MRNGSIAKFMRANDTFASCAMNSDKKMNTQNQTTC